MKIVIVSCVAPPETGVSGRVNWDIAQYLSNTGYQVVFISPYPSRPMGSFSTNDNNKITQKKINKNFIHIRINSFSYPEYNLLNRAFESYDFGIKTIKYINKYHQNAKIIYATLWPFIGQLMFVMFRRNRHIPLIMNVQDLYPESFLTKIRFKWLKFLLSSLLVIDKKIANASTHLTVISKAMEKTYIETRGITKNKITVIENWQDETLFLNYFPDLHSILKKYDLEIIQEKFKFMYLGNIGPVAGLEEVIKYFMKINTGRMALIIAGSGTSKQNCKDLVESLNAKNIYFVDLPPGLDSVVELQSIADVLVLPMIEGAASSSIPSKLIAYMFSSKPIITSAEQDSETGLAINNSGCGYFVDKIYSWSNQMERIVQLDENERMRMGRNGFEYAVSRYSKSIGLKKIDQLLYQIINI